MQAYRTRDGKLMAPLRAEGDGLLGDGWHAVEAESTEGKAWLDWYDQRGEQVPPWPKDAVIDYLSRAGAGGEATLSDLLSVLADAGVREEDRLPTLAQLAESGQIQEEDHAEEGIVYRLPGQGVKEGLAPLDLEPDTLGG